MLYVSLLQYARAWLTIRQARYDTAPVPQFKIPSTGTDAQAAYQLVSDELALDGSPLLNLASFVHTWMPKEADQLMVRI